MKNLVNSHATMAHLHLLNDYRYNALKGPASYTQRSLREKVKFAALNIVAEVLQKYTNAAN